MDFVFTKFTLVSRSWSPTIFPGAGCLRKHQVGHRSIGRDRRHRASKESPRQSWTTIALPRYVGFVSRLYGTPGAAHLHAEGKNYSARWRRQISALPKLA